MEWKTIRETFKAERETRELSQADVVGMNQAMISKLEINDKKGPTVETFVNAVCGLGISVSEFFRQIEGAPVGSDLAVGSSPQGTTAVDRDAGLPSLASEQEMVWIAIQTLANTALRERERANSAHHRPAPSPHTAATEGARHSRTRPQRTPPQTKKRRPTGQRKR